MKISALLLGTRDLIFLMSTFDFECLIKILRVFNLLSQIVNVKSQINNYVKQYYIQKIGACARLSNHLNDSWKNLVFTVVTKSQFSLSSSKRINKVHEWALRVVLNIYASVSEALFQKIMAYKTTNRKTFRLF